MPHYYDLEQNSFPIRDWHVKHMERTLVKFVTGLSDDSSNWERRMNKKYGRLTRVCKRIEYDIKHGVTSKQVYSFLQLLRTESTFSEIRAHDGSMERLNEIQGYFTESSNHNRNTDMWNY